HCSRTHVQSRFAGSTSRASDWNCSSFHGPHLEFRGWDPSHATLDVHPVGNVGRRFWRRGHRSVSGERGPGSAKENHPEREPIPNMEWHRRYASARETRIKTNDDSGHERALLRAERPFTPA